MSSPIGHERVALRPRLLGSAHAEQLNHPGIIAIYDHGEKSDVSYIVME